MKLIKFLLFVLWILIQFCSITSIEEWPINNYRSFFDNLVQSPNSNLIPGVPSPLQLQRKILNPPPQEAPLCSPATPPITAFFKIQSVFSQPPTSGPCAPASPAVYEPLLPSPPLSLASSTKFGAPFLADLTFIQPNLPPHPPALETPPHTPALETPPLPLPPLEQQLLPAPSTVRVYSPLPSIEPPSPSSPPPSSPLASLLPSPLPPLPFSSSLSLPLVPQNFILRQPPPPGTLVSLPPTSAPLPPPPPPLPSSSPQQVFASPPPVSFPVINMRPLTIRMLAPILRDYNLAPQTLAAPVPPSSLPYCPPPAPNCLPALLSPSPSTMITCRPLPCVDSSLSPPPPQSAPTQNFLSLPPPPSPACIPSSACVYPSIISPQLPPSQPAALQPSSDFLPNSICVSPEACSSIASPLPSPPIANPSCISPLCFELIQGSQQLPLTQRMLSPLQPRLYASSPPLFSFKRTNREIEKKTNIKLTENKKNNNNEKKIFKKLLI